MTKLFTTPQGELLLLYPFQNRILFQIKGSEGYSRLSVLAQDYGSSFDSILHQDSLYFSYVSEGGQITLRTVGRADPVFATPHVADAGAPFLVSIGERLLLFHVQQTADLSYQVHASLPLSPELDFSLQGVFDTPPALLWSQTGNAVLLILQVGEHPRLCQVGEDLTCNYLTPPAATQDPSALAASREREAALQAENVRLNQIISSIKLQYEELMDVAEQYRQETQKWYNRFVLNKS